ncbi:ABC transporter substrate-binding protein [Streptomyces laurentii]
MGAGPRQRLTPSLYRPRTARAAGLARDQEARSAKASTKWLTAPLAASLAATLLSGCGTQQGGDSGSSEDTVRIGMSDEILAIDPAAGYDPGSWILFNNVFQTLVAFPNGGSRPAPEAARQCGFSAGSTVYTCTLRDGLTFSNGNPLTSEDVKFSFERTLKIDDPSGPASLLSSIDTIETPDPQTGLEWTLDANAVFRFWEIKAG